MIQNVGDILQRLRTTRRYGRISQRIIAWSGRKPGRHILYVVIVHVRLASARCGAAIGGQLVRPAQQRSLLLLAWLFPPRISGGVYRPTAQLKYGARYGWQFNVLTGPIPDTPSVAGDYLQRQIPSSVGIHRTEKLRYPKKDPRLPEVDGGLLNALEAYRVGVRLYKKQPPALVLASGPPFHNLIAAALLARRFSAKLVLEYRDEWSECPFPWVSKHPDNRVWETWCLARADLVIFTTGSQLAHQVATFDTLDSERCIVLPNGWDPTDFAGSSVASRAFPLHRTLELAYFGHFGAMGGPEDFLADLAVVLAKNADLRRRFVLRIYGKKTRPALSQLQRFAFPECIDLIDQVPKQEACSMMKRSGALLLLNPPTLARYIQGKLFDYIASGSPLLIYGEGGEIGSIVTSCRAGIIVPSQQPTNLEQALLNVGNHRIDRARADEWLRRHTRDRIAKDTMQTLDKLDQTQRRL